jgi:hypothetical protein
MRDMEPEIGVPDIHIPINVGLLTIRDREAVSGRQRIVTYLCSL